MKDEVLSVLAKHHLAVIATVTRDAHPEAAIVGYTHNSELQLLVGTSEMSRKFANISKNSHVALAIGDTESEIQYEGTVKILDATELEELRESSFPSLPGTAKYQQRPDQRWLLISPTWIRLVVHGEADRVEELELT